MPLNPYTKLSPSIYLHQPSKTTTKPIILCFWMNAPARALSKYITEYKRLAPGSPLLIILSTTADIIWSSTERAQRARLSPALEILRTLAPNEAVHMHMFSNGGVFSAVHLLDLYRGAVGCALPVASMLFDSAPGTASVGGAVRAVSYGILPARGVMRVLGMVGLWVVFWVALVVVRVLGGKDAVSFARERVNDVGLTGVGRRCYFYSEGDDLVEAVDVEGHAVLAENLGFVVRREKFEGSRHVSHMLVDSGRYWRVVAEYL
ncbi:hypothetical protein BDV25DRAFT_128005 [Aspergillus avenaceus]|uniref:Indole-diterpene biosynthesis protein PaxU n=1 Tax=Aspergillus avenaceus TaxID=36643 RepID=A0A5N6U1I3_ASPAV|nr:hypothetical protein BDV25DRAFT_128005 [Aspergillus avenaceus]